MWDRQRSGDVQHPAVRHGQRTQPNPAGECSRQRPAGGHGRRPHRLRRRRQRHPQSPGPAAVVSEINDIIHLLNVREETQEKLKKDIQQHPAAYFSIILGCAI